MATSVLSKTSMLLLIILSQLVLSAYSGDDHGTLQVLSDTARTQARLKYLEGCLNIRSPTPVRSQWLSEPVLLKWHAFWLWSRTASLREVPVRTVPWAQQPLWQEIRWEAALGKPVQRCVNGTAYAAEMEYARSALEPGPRDEDEDRHGSSTPLSHGASTYNKKEQVYMQWAADGACPGVVVEEPFDYGLFHPWVPLFVHWDDVATMGPTPFGGGAALDGAGTVLYMAQALAPHLRDDVQYITLMARGAGFFMSSYVHFANLTRHVLVLSPGGRGGHVPVPLLHPDDTQQPPAHRVQGEVEQSCVLGFVGTFHDGVRQVMYQQTKDHPAWKDRVQLKASNTSDANSAWREVMSKCMLQLAPCGTNPTSFRLYESLQLGTIPVYVWEDVLWLPYVDMKWEHREWCRAWMTWQEWQGGVESIPAECRTLWHDWAVVVHIEDYPAWLSHATHGLQAWVKDRGRREEVRQNIAQARQGYFTHEGVMDHVARFIHDPMSSELYCVP